MLATSAAEIGGLAIAARCRGLRSPSVAEDVVRRYPHGGHFTRERCLSCRGECFTIDLEPNVRTDGFRPNLRQELACHVEVGTLDSRRGVKCDPAGLPLLCRRCSVE